MKLTIGMATYDDYDGVYFTVQSLRLHHPLPAGAEILVLDNNPKSPAGDALRQLEKDVPELRVVPVTDRKTSFVKYDMFKHAAGDVVLGLDCHVLLAPSFFPALLEYWADPENPKDMLTGPLAYDALTRYATHMNPEWRGHDFGTWGDNAEGRESGRPFQVPMQGMACFSFLREHFPGVNPHFRGFGAEEWYVAEKVRAQGGRVLCHPSMVWVHRFNWPVRTFPLTLNAKVVNYYRGWLELYQNMDDPRIEQMTAHWSGLMGRGTLKACIRHATVDAPVEMN